MASRDGRRPTRGPAVAGVELAAGGVRVVVGRAEEGVLHVSGNAFVPVPRGAISGGLVVGRAAAAAALTSALAQAEGRDRAGKLVVALDADDVRTYHHGTIFERTAAAERIVQGEVERAVRQALEESTESAQRRVADDPALRGVATTLLRDDVAGFVLDGRSLDAVDGFQGRYVEVRTDVSFAPLLQAGAANSTLEAAKRRGTIASGIYALARLLASSGYGDGGVLRLGPDSTAFAVVRGGRVVVTRVFGLGRDAFTARESSRLPDAEVWAECVLAPLTAAVAEGDDQAEGALPGRWLFVGVPESLLALPRALGEALAVRRGGDVDITPLRVGAASRVVGSGLHADDLVACGAAALAAEL